MGKKGYEFYLKGGKELKKALQIRQDLKPAVQKVVRQNTGEMQREAERIVPVDTGALKRSFIRTYQDDGMTGIVKPTMEYAPYVEFGTRFMEAQPYLGPAFNKQVEQFEKDLKKLMD